MDTASWIVFDRIMMFATGNKMYLKNVLLWERVSKRFSDRLRGEIWPNISMCIDFFALHADPCRMTIQYEEYKSIDLRVLLGFKQRGIHNSSIFFYDIPIDFVLPEGFAASVPLPSSLRLGEFQNFSDPELLSIILVHRHCVKELLFTVTNPSMNENFMDAFQNLNKLNYLTIVSDMTLQPASSVVLRQAVFAKVNRITLTCLKLMSDMIPGFSSIFDCELFMARESGSVQCLHLHALNHCIEKWLTDNRFHNRAQISHLCILNDNFGYYIAEQENKLSPLFHSLADYRLLFPKLQFACIGISIMDEDDNGQLDSMLRSYFTANSFNVKLHLSIRLFHKLPEVPVEKLERLMKKLKKLDAEVIFVEESETDACIQIRSKNKNTFSHIRVCFDRKDVKSLLDVKLALSENQLHNCADFCHAPRCDVYCLCARNCR